MEAELASIDWSSISFKDNVKTRSLTRQHTWSLLVCSKLSLPLVLACGMFVFLYLNGQSTLSAIDADAHMSFVQEMRKVSASSCRYQ